VRQHTVSQQQDPYLRTSIIPGFFAVRKNSCGDNKNDGNNEVPCRIAPAAPIVGSFDEKEPQGQELVIVSPSPNSRPLLDAAGATGGNLPERHV
jgi:hypothetical protein